ncbi:MAG: hypothetical protein LPK85_13985, partial [Gammaproteobacteria bacterium]|nr:hypothetical protein [Gammaproteobacteria bacterium]
ASLARVHGLMAQGEAYCHPALLRKPERERIMHFSEPAHFILTHRIMIRADRLALFEPFRMPDGSIDAQRLVKNPALVTAMSEKRAYSPSISAALAELDDDRHILRAGVEFKSPFHQLMEGWIDYLFAYPVEYGWYQHQGQGLPEQALLALRIHGDPELIIGYVTCTRSEWGATIIREVNAAMHRVRGIPPWIERAIQYTAPSELEAYLRALERESPYRTP